MSQEIQSNVLANFNDSGTVVAEHIGQALWVNFALSFVLFLSVVVPMVYLAWKYRADKVKNEDIEKTDDKFSIKTEDSEYKNYDKVLISSGLGAAPQLRASEDGMNIASKFGHSFNMTYPSLVGLQTSFEYASKVVTSNYSAVILAFNV